MNNSPIEVAKKLASLKVLFPKNKIKEFPASYASLRFGDEREEAVHQLILEQLTKCEAVLPGSSGDVVKMASSGLVPTSKKRDFICKPPSKEELLSSLRSQGFSQEVSSLAWVASSLAGATGKVRVERCDVEVASIELALGHTFEVQSPLGEFVSRGCRVAVFDAFVESVQEVHHLLQEAAESSEEVVVVARNFSNDVLNTFSVNSKRGTLRVWPLVCPLDERGINTLKDICVVTGAELVSSDMGQLLSSVRLSSLASCKRLAWRGGSLTIDKSVDAAGHLEYLRKKSDEQDSEAMQKLFAARAASMASRSAVIRIPDTIAWGMKVQELDTCIRLTSKILSGVVALSAEDDEDIRLLLASRLDSALQSISSLG